MSFLKSQKFIFHECKFKDLSGFTTKRNKNFWMFVPKKSRYTKKLGSSDDETNFIWSRKIFQWFISWLKVQKSSSFSDILKKVKTFCLQLYNSSPYFSCCLCVRLPHWHGGAKTNSNNSFTRVAKWNNEKIFNCAYT